MSQNEHAIKNCKSCNEKYYQGAQPFCLLYKNKIDENNDINGRFCPQWSPIKCNSEPYYNGA